MKLLIICLVIINILGFFAMGIDKERAQKKCWRIPEKTLFAIALLGGGLGVWLGMYMFRHKTKHDYFVKVISVVMIIQMAFLFVFLWRVG
ncbi:MAG: DUF1294 domain-containing protein [Lachnospiraceae bacterium]|nr:DUF1294 domain-containing protein [Lachnospiraceae bacterium]